MPECTPGCLARVVCLHGVASGDDILKCQLGRLVFAAKGVLDLVVLEGPRECSSPELVEKMASFFGRRNKRFMMYDEEGLDSRLWRTYREPLETLGWLRDRLRELAPVHGVLGFSQGASFATMLAAQAAAEDGISLSFVCLLSPLAPGYVRQLPDLFRVPIEVPALVVRGEQEDLRAAVGEDAWRAALGDHELPASDRAPAEHVAALFRNAEVVTHSEEHKPLPSAKEASEQIVGHIISFASRHCGGPTASDEEIRCLKPPTLAGQPWDQGSPQEYTFDMEGSGWVEHLRLHGFCVLRDLISIEDFQALEEQFWADIAHVVPGLRREDPSTWDFPKPGGHNPTGIVRGYGVPQSDFAWMLRLHPRVRLAFAGIFGTPDLVVSTDSLKLSDTDVPPPGPPWLHRDCLRDVQAYSVQGIFSFYDVGPRNSGTILVPGSHEQFHAWDDVQDGRPMLRAKGRRRNSVRLPEEVQQSFMERAMKPRVPERGMILFDSRVVHASAPDSVQRWRVEAEDRPAPSKPRPNRVGISVAMCPRARRSELSRRRKVQVYLEQASTAHWPCDELNWPSERGYVDPKDREVWDRFAGLNPMKPWRHLPRPGLLEERMALL